MREDQEVGEVFRGAREAKGLSQDDCDAQCGLGYSYHHIESAQSEFFDNISLGQACRLCNLLGLEILTLTATYLDVTIEKRGPVSDAQFYSRHGLISDAQREKSLTDDQLGEFCGYSAEAISGVERSSDAIEAMTIRFVVDLAKALDLDPGELICAR